METQTNSTVTKFQQWMKKNLVKWFHLLEKNLICALIFQILVFFMKINTKNFHHTYFKPFINWVITFCPLWSFAKWSPFAVHIYPKCLETMDYGLWSFPYWNITYLTFLKLKVKTKLVSWRRIPWQRFRCVVDTDSRVRVSECVIRDEEHQQPIG